MYSPEQATNIVKINTDSDFVFCVITELSSNQQVWITSSTLRD